MLSNLKSILIFGVLAFVGYQFFMGGGTQSADLGQVLDRSVFALEKYDGYLNENQIEEPSTEEMNQLTGFMTEVMNTEPRFYDSTLGVALQPDASFQGYADANNNSIQDAGEDEVFTLEIDSANSRLIATDTSGEAAHSGFSGTGFLAGALIGSLLSRQSRAGVKPGAFSSRTSTSRNAYSAPSSARSRARSGGLGRGK